jgi:hypothetical protein
MPRVVALRTLSRHFRSQTRAAHGASRLTHFTYPILHCRKTIDHHSKRCDYQRDGSSHELEPQRRWLKVEKRWILDSPQPVGHVAHEKDVLHGARRSIDRDDNTSWLGGCRGRNDPSKPESKPYPFAPCVNRRSQQPAFRSGMFLRNRNRFVASHLSCSSAQRCSGLFGTEHRGF